MAEEVSGVQYSAALIAPAFDSSFETSSLGTRSLLHKPLDSSVKHYTWCSQGRRESMIDLSSQSVTLECWRKILHNSMHVARMEYLLIMLML